MVDPPYSPYFDTRAAGVPDTSRGKEVAQPRNHLSHRDLGFDGIQNPDSRLQRAGDQQSWFFSPSRCPNGGPNKRAEDWATEGASGELETFRIGFCSDGRSDENAAGSGMRQ
jgi:hypothetical protein